MVQSTNNHLNASCPQCNKSMRVIPVYCDNVFDHYTIHCDQCGYIDIVNANQDDEVNDMNNALVYVWLDVLKNQLINDVADERLIIAIKQAQQIIKEKVTGYSE
ncbi:hypothetical protein QUF88_19280 [Bacillus sp. DX1.1]|uniref:hypothetical protein n=1 Tax=unclassified Bacillus (in: firmicutes) TaxID=185979 RepID=UPI00256FCE78|nr:MULTISPECIES: hypothetical protein [unclassified Bacillus (in: firmicutes)]MDM5155855.1 hypothetical protein [Bacillus sp. DX1.1]WJE80151.1 hypothetical protein QRE67_16810 [Bacillus sp. DX3.1]